MTYERLSPQDALFLHLENEHQPMHVGSLAHLEGEPFFRDGRFCLDQVRERIAPASTWCPGSARRSWTCRSTRAGRSGSTTTIRPRLPRAPHRPAPPRHRGAAARAHGAPPVPAARPTPAALGDLVRRGAEDDRVAIIQKTHHCLIDGVSGIDVATVLLDLEPTRRPSRRPSGCRAGARTRGAAGREPGRAGGRTRRTGAVRAGAFRGPSRPAVSWPGCSAR